MNKIPIAVIDKEKEIIEKISTLLKNVSGLEITQINMDLKDLEIILEEKIPTLVLLGPSCRMEDVEGLLKSHSTGLRFVRVILLVRETSATLFKKAIKLNIHDVLAFPFIYNDLKESIERAVDIIKEELAEKSETPRTVEHEKQSSKKITIFSTKGGSGKSFLASNLAIDLITQTKKNVVLFDFNYQFGDVALMLNLYPKHTIYDIMSVIDQLDSEMLNSFLTTHSSGVKILPSPIDPSKGEAISTKTTMKVIDILSKIA
ncbi:unnamed protein product, partial [marine sediment metagenome]